MITNARNPAQLARRTGLSARDIQAFIDETHLITPKAAIRLSLATTAFYWLALQARYDLERGKPVLRAYRPLAEQAG